MKIILVGATGTIGKGIQTVLGKHHDIATVGNRGGDFQVDLGSSRSIEKLYDDVGSFDAVISAAGQARFGNIGKLSEDDFAFSAANKLMGQVNLVRLGLSRINANGSFTLTSGILAQHPMPGSAAISMVNAGLEGFVRAAALEAERGVRVNAVSPIWVSETLEAMGKNGAEGLPAAKTALAYKAAVETDANGQVLDVRDFV
jgi:NAD(P)-dependent dehydrogenase (short-subunit alcohol dehydrogenase family)